ncbi:MAG: hypothetical protein ABEJ03_00360 [Candidatus Nanohaloarchaea archaeon]
MAPKFTRERLMSSQQVYSVFRRSVLKDRGVYSKRLHDEGLVGSREDANRMLSALEKMGVLDKGERTRAQYYVPAYSSFSQLLSDIFENDVELPSDFLQKYVEGYVSVNESASLREMLTTDLVTFMTSYRRKNEEVPDFVDRFLSSLGPEVSDFDRRADLVEFAIDNRDVSVADLDDFGDWLED